MHQELAERGLLPSRQLVDAGYIDADILATQQARFKVEVLGPTRGNFRWQAREQTGFEGHHFTIDWETQRALQRLSDVCCLTAHICPMRSSGKLEAMVLREARVVHIPA